MNILTPAYSKHACRLDRLFNNLMCSSNERRYYSDIYSQSCHRSVQRFTTDKPKVRENLRAYSNFEILLLLLINE